MSETRSVTATYRLQMNAGFTFADARAQVGYFSRLGVSHLYLSPVLASRRGSMHGYDTVDPSRVDSELGGEAGLLALASDLQARGMGLIVDIVPNHMGIGPENPYWEDVLAHGERSRFAKWFDIDWTSRDLGHRRLVLPVLGDELDRVLERGELSVRARQGEMPRLVYHAQSFPLDASSLPAELQLVTLDPEETGELTALFSGTQGRDRLRALLDIQHYELEFWRRGATDINYRRFFDVNDLAALRMDDETVFHGTHELILRLVRAGVIDGLRVDHIDGLRDPLAYLERLRAALPPGTPVFVEKILSVGEQLRDSWPVDGTTGYEFLNDLDDVFLDPAGFAEIEASYRRMRRLGATTFGDVALAGKIGVLTGPLRADVDRLAVILGAITRSAGKRWTRGDVTAALVECLAALPVYRTYIDGHPAIDDTDRAVIEAMSRTAQAHAPAVAGEIAFIGDLLLDAVLGVDANARLRFIHGLQQLSGPAAAKGVEDTALYVYVPLASRNEVGGSPDRFLEDAVARLHEANLQRSARWPRGLIAASTHDSKRSADIRARLAAISEMPREWDRSVRRWRKLNARHRRTVKGRLAPDTNTEYLLYQTLVGLWPAPRAGRRSDDVPDRGWLDDTRARVERYLVKAAREAKTRTSWVDPDAAYESALKDFVGAVLVPGDDAPFLADVARIVSRLAPLGVWNSLSRVAVQLTAPGVPDIYQGDESWNVALVDPDNRNQVNYEARSAALEQLEAQSGQRRRFDTALKLDVVRRLLALRRDRVDVFTRGDYRSLIVYGSRSSHVVAFARSFGGRHVITIASRLLSTMPAGDSAEWWGNTQIELPDDLQGRPWKSRLDGTDVAPASTLEVASLLHTIPVAVVAD